MTRILGLCADDFGLAPGISAGIAKLAQAQRLSAVSCITNYAAGITNDVPNHEEVIEVGRRAAQSFSDLLEAATPELAKVS